MSFPSTRKSAISDQWMKSYAHFSNLLKICKCHNFEWEIRKCPIFEEPSAKIKSAKIKVCSVSISNLWRGVISGWNFPNAALQDANFPDVKFTDAKFPDGIFRIKFSGHEFSGCDISGQEISGREFSGYRSISLFVKAESIILVLFESLDSKLSIDTKILIVTFMHEEIVL